MVKRIAINETPVTNPPVTLTPEAFKALMDEMQALRAAVQTKAADVLGCFALYLGGEQMIVIEKDRAFGWIAVRDSRVELCTPHFGEWSDLALWAMQKYPAEPVGILASDIAGGPGVLAAKHVTGCAILWMTTRRPA